MNLSDNVAIWMTALRLL